MPFTDTQAKALVAKLSAKHVKTRQHGGVTLSYIEGWHAIAEANRIFGFDAWDRETISAQCVWNRARNGHHECSYIAQVRIRVRAGDTVICREGSGSGHGFRPTPGEAHESALKQAETDAMKRALATFGNSFGLALYDKEQNGVRRPIARKSKPIDGRQVSWVVLGATGKPLSTHGDPVEYCSALRKKLKEIEVAEEAKAFWTRNRNSIESLRKDLPWLRTNKGEHYADILEALYKLRLEKPSEHSKAKAIEPKVNNTATAVDKSLLAISTSKRVRDKAHLRYVASQPCLVCGRNPCQSHHVRFAQPRAMGRKVSDEWVVPLCAIHHRSLHDVGDEKRWWKQHGSIDPISEAERLWKQTRATKVNNTVDELRVIRQATN